MNEFNAELRKHKDKTVRLFTKNSFDITKPCLLKKINLDYVVLDDIEINRTVNMRMSNIVGFVVVE